MGADQSGDVVTKYSAFWQGSIACACVCNRCGAVVSKTVGDQERHNQMHADIDSAVQLIVSSDLVQLIEQRDDLVTEASLGQADRETMASIRKWLTHPAQAMSIEVDGVTLHVSKKSFLTAMNEVLETMQTAAEAEVGPHSRACGWQRHDHGVACHTNCPTCHGIPEGN